MTERPSLVGQIISGCEILEKTAEGGMGAVYRARHRALNRIVCVKILSPALSNDKKAVELFLTEARAIAELDHPNIVNVYNVGKEHGYYFIVMSFIEGQTLSAKLKKEKVIPLGTILDLFDGVLQGLDAAHAQGIIHRDIKPSNILITPQGQAKLVDFGIAKKVDKSGSTKTSELAGTAYFIAPEQALGQNIDTRADLYSIGASLFYVVTGQFPYNGKTTIDIIQKHINNPLPDPNTLRKNLPPWLGPAIQKLMSKNPDDRFATAKETYMYFRKMRADDQFRFQAGNNGKAIDLGNESPRLVVTEKYHSTQTFHAPVRPAGPKTQTQPVFNTSLMPKINIGSTITEPLPQSQTPEKRTTDSAVPPSEIPSVSEQTINPQPFPKQSNYKSEELVVTPLGEAPSPTVKINFWPLVIFLPLYLLFAGIITFVFFNIGNLGASQVSASASLLQNLIAPFITALSETGSLTFPLLGIVMIVLIFVVSRLRAFSRCTMNLLFLAFVSFITGLFATTAPITDINNVLLHVLSPEYDLCYLMIALSLGLSACWTINRTRAQGVLGASLVIFAIGMAFVSARLSIAPNTQQPLFSALFYASLLCGVGASYYLISQEHKDSIVVPCLLLLAAVSGMWIYTVSGLEDVTRNAINTLVARIEVRTGENYQQNNIEQEKELGNFHSAKSAINISSRLNEFSAAPREHVIAELDKRIEKVAPEVFDTDSRTAMAKLLAPFYQEGEAAMKWKIWGYAVSYPLNHFNRNAQTNGAYFFLIFMLYLVGLVSCANTLLFREDL